MTQQLYRFLQLVQPTLSRWQVSHQIDAVVKLAILQFYVLFYAYQCLKLFLPH